MDLLKHYKVMLCSVLGMLVLLVDDYLVDRHDMGIHAMAENYQLIMYFR